MTTSLKIAIVTPVLPARGGMGSVAANHARLLSERGQEVVLFAPAYANLPARNAQAGASAGRPDYGDSESFTPHPRIKVCPALDAGYGAGSNPLLRLRQCYGGQVGEERGQEIPSPFKGEGQGEGLEERGFRIELIKPLVKYGNAAWLPNLGTRLSDFNIVILHYPFFGGAGAVYRARKKYGFKLVVYYHMDAVGTGFKKIIFDYNTRYFLPRLINRSDLVLTSSEDLARHSYLGRYWQEGNKKFAVVPIGVDVDFFRPRDSSAPPAESAGGARNGKEEIHDDNEKIVLFVGMLDAAHYFKGVEYLIRAAALIKRGDFKAVIVGTGDLLPHYQKLARDLKAGDKIVFIGEKFGADLIPYFQKATVTVLPSVSSESFGIVLVESMACATPVVATDLPGPRSVFEDGISGFVVPARDSRALAEKIEYLLSNPAKARAMGLAGRRLVEQKHDWEKIGDKLCTLLV